MPKFPEISGPKMFRHEKFGAFFWVCARKIAVDTPTHMFQKHLWNKKPTQKSRWVCHQDLFRSYFGERVCVVPPYQVSSWGGIRMVWRLHPWSLTWNLENQPLENGDSGLGNPSFFRFQPLNFGGVSCLLGEALTLRWLCCLVETQFETLICLTIEWYQCMHLQ